MQNYDKDADLNRLPRFKEVQDNQLNGSPMYERYSNDAEQKSIWDYHSLNVYKDDSKK